MNRNNCANFYRTTDKPFLFCCKYDPNGQVARRAIFWTVRALKLGILFYRFALITQLHLRVCIVTPYGVHANKYLLEWLQAIYHIF